MIFVDTGPFLGRYLKRDQHHARAVRGFDLLEGRPAVTSSHVLDETFTLLGRWAGNGFAAERARAILASRTIRILRPSASDEVAALEEFERYADRKLSYTDALSFVLMRERGIREAFTFDRHFPMAGFALWPEDERP